MKILKKLIVGLGALILVYALFLSIVFAAADSNVEAEFGGIARPDENGTWYVLDDAAQTPICLSSVSQTSTYIQINYCKELSVIRWVMGGIDERLVQSHIDVGVEELLGGARLYFVQDGTLLNPSSITSTAYPSANIFLYVRGQL